MSALPDTIDGEYQLFDVPKRRGEPEKWELHQPKSFVSFHRERESTLSITAYSVTTMSALPDTIDGEYQLFDVPKRRGEPEKWELHQRYSLQCTIGEGAYGTVCSGVDKWTGQEVAIKRVSKPFNRSLHAKRLLREVKFLRYFNGHDNIINLHDIMRPRTFEAFDDVYVVTSLMESDLQDVLRSSRDFNELHCQCFLYQMLSGLRYIHAGNVVHRDLKPGNILVNKNCELKICDFGMARRVDLGEEKSSENPLTMYVTTRWYRAPEIVLCSPVYDFSVDVWSVGCIFAEMLMKLSPHGHGPQALFPGKNYRDQLDRIIRVIGTPSYDDIQGVGNPNSLVYLGSLPYCPPVPMEEIFPHVSPEAIDLLSSMLQFAPGNRISVGDALQHPYLSSFVEEYVDSPLDFPTPVGIFDHSFETVPDKDLKYLMYEEMRLCNPDIPPLEMTPTSGSGFLPGMDPFS
eukprot:TRINITY_DN143_c1_g2_i2.p1 TRINITY_DN143_c1_g2~~TRINITY_DN143_c1_g2_i2.p1  ORF type:complete len:459 (-),score=85.90 TRINITY_DN143_c1_g2_i2:178-1554(-)